MVDLQVMNPHPSGTRRPRFRRVEPRPFLITPRDIDIIRIVWRHRFLRSTHIVELLAASPPPLLRRLQLLYHGGFLDRPRTQIDYFALAGSKPMVYGLGNRGADLLAERFGVARERVDWTAKNRSVSPVFLEHTLLIADVMVGFELACRAHGRIRIISPGTIARSAPGADRSGAAPLQWTVDVRHEGKRVPIGVIPDKIFGLHFLDEPEGRNRSYFFLEADRGTMPVVRKTLERTSFHRKLLAYRETWRQGLHTKHFGFRAFRVLTVTSGADRCRNVLQAAKDVVDGHASGLFLFTDRAALVGKNVLEMPWLRPGLSPASLLG